jgi:hypothetical protein
MMKTRRFLLVCSVFLFFSLFVSVSPSFAANNIAASSEGAYLTSSDWYLPEGWTGYDTYIAICNPNGAATTVMVWFDGANGGLAWTTRNIPAYSRSTVRANDYLPPNTSFATHIYDQGV